MIMRRWAAWVALIAGVAAAPAALGSDLVTTFELATKNDPTFRAATYDKFAQDETLRIAWSRLLPSITGHLDWSMERQDVRSSDNTVFAVGSTSFPRTEYGARLTQPVFRLTEMSRVYQAKAETRKAAAEVDAAYQDLVFRVADAYFAVLAAEDELALRKRERVALARQRELADRRLEAGLGIAPDLYEAEARLALAEADEEIALFRLEDARQALAEITGVLESDLRGLSADLPLAVAEPANPDVWVRNAVAHNPELEAARQAFEISEREVNLRRSGHAPTLDLEAGYNASDTGGSLFGGGSNVDTGDVALKVRVPLFSGGGVMYATRRAIDLRKRQRELMVRTQRSTERQTRSAFQAVSSTSRRVGALRKTVESQQLALRGREKAVKSGLDTTLNVLNAERELYADLRDYAQGRYDYVRSVLKLEQSAGALGVEDLERVNEWLTEP
jgi:outer membrane protein